MDKRTVGQDRLTGRQADLFMALTNSRAASKSATPSNGSPRQINRWTNILQCRQINRQADLFMALTNYKSVKPSNGSPRQINKWIDIPLEGQIDR